MFIQNFKENAQHTGMRHLGRMTPEEAANVLGCKPHDIPVLVRARLLKPLGDPPANATKYFAATAVQRLAADETWLGRMTKTLNSHWFEQNRKRSKRPHPDVSKADCANRNDSNEIQ